MGLLKKMKKNVVYNHSDNMIMVQSRGNRIVIICNSEEQLEKVQDRFYKSGNNLIDYEEWDEGDDKRYIVSFQVSTENTPINN